jgi:MerR family transcriptional regulator, light-induced transcriptional regulator
MGSTSEISSTTADPTSRLNEEGEAGGLRHCIGVVSRVTGIGLDTLRVWERRYGVPSPYRDAAGARFYSEDDIQHLRLVSQAIRVGYRPRDVLKMESSALRSLLSELSRTPTVDATGGPVSDDVITDLSRLVQRCEVLVLQNELRRLATTHGTRRFISEVISPLIERAGQDWEKGKLDLFQQRLLTEAIETEVRFQTALLRAISGPVVVLGALPGESHQLPLSLIGLCMAASTMLVHGLGTNVETEQLVKAAKALKASVVGVSVTLSSTAGETEEQLVQLANRLPLTTELWVGGSGADNLPDLPKRIQILSGWDELDAAIAGLRP